MARQRRPFNLMRTIAQARWLPEARRLEWFPPFWLMRIRVLELSDQWRRVRILLPLTAISRNAGGNMYGGFQASLADPIPALACLRLFPGHSIWTRRLQLDFRHEGRTDLELRFEVDPEQEAQIHADLAARGRSNPCFKYGFYMVDGSLSTVVHNTVAIRPRGYRPRSRGDNETR
jgi:acyl-coenzyme A thioesterase PaaI-like protein